MRMYRIGVLACVAVLASVGAAQAGGYALEPVPGSPDQEIRFDRGVATISSNKEHGSVRLAPTAETLNKQIPLAVVAFNKGAKPITLGYENLSGTLPDGSPAVLITYERLQKEAKTAAAWQALAIGLAGAANSYAAAQSSYTTTYGTANSFGYGTPRFTSFSATTYNPGVAQANMAVANVQTEVGIATIQAGLDEKLSSLGNNILRTTTADPQQTVGGLVVIEKPKLAKDGAQVLTVVVAWDGEPHEFKFNLVKK